MAAGGARDKLSVMDVEVSKEQALLQTYFLHFSKFSFDKAKEIIVRELFIDISLHFLLNRCL
jgi:hypothetical protein